jgi:hypothetical protein
MEKRRVRQIVDYAQGSRCRRAAIAEVFGDEPLQCGRSDHGRCDVCSGSPPFWHDVPLDHVPDPEELVDVELVTMQAVRWTRRPRKDGTDRYYSETNVKAAICGKEVVGTFALSPGLFDCPQFGAARYLRGSDKRVAEAIDRLLRKGALVRRTVEYQGRSYTALDLTERGRSALGGAGR